MAQGKIVQCIGAVVDVTDARKTERKLRRSEAYLAEAQRLSHTSSWAWDVHRGEFVYRSAEVYNLFGIDPEKDGRTQFGFIAQQVQGIFPSLVSTTSPAAFFTTSVHLMK